MAESLTITDLRRTEADEYQRLSKMVIERNISALPVTGVRRLEELHQLANNGELDPNAKEYVLKQLAKERITKLQERLKQGQPPCENLFFGTWRWNPKTNEFEWRGSIGPSDAPGGKFSWQPEWVRWSNPYSPEGTSQGRL